MFTADVRTKSWLLPCSLGMQTYNFNAFDRQGGGRGGSFGAPPPGAGHMQQGGEDRDPFGAPPVGNESRAGFSHQPPGHYQHQPQAYPAQSFPQHQSRPATSFPAQMSQPRTSYAHRMSTGNPYGTAPASYGNASAAPPTTAYSGNTVGTPFSDGAYRGAGKPANPYGTAPASYGSASAAPPTTAYSGNTVGNQFSDGAYRGADNPTEMHHFRPDNTAGGVHVFDRPPGSTGESHHQQPQHGPPGNAQGTHVFDGPRSGGGHPTEPVAPGPPHLPTQHQSAQPVAGLPTNSIMTSTQRMHFFDGPPNPTENSKSTSFFDGEAPGGATPRQDPAGSAQNTNFFDSQPLSRAPRTETIDSRPPGLPENTENTNFFDNPPPGGVPKTAGLSRTPAKETIASGSSDLPGHTLSTNFFDSPPPGGPPTTEAMLPGPSSPPENTQNTNYFDGPTPLTEAMAPGLPSTPGNRQNGNIFDAPPFAPGPQSSAGVAPLPGHPVVDQPHEGAASSSNSIVDESRRYGAESIDTYERNSSATAPAEFSEADTVLPLQTAGKRQKFGGGPGTNTKTQASRRRSRNSEGDSPPNAEAAERSDPGIAMTIGPPGLGQSSTGDSAPHASATGSEEQDSMYAPAAEQDFSRTEHDVLALQSEVSTLKTKLAEMEKRAVHAEERLESSQVEMKETLRIRDEAMERTIQLKLEDQRAEYESRFAAASEDAEKKVNALQLECARVKAEMTEKMDDMVAEERRALQAEFRVQEEEQSRSLAEGYEEQRNELVSMMKSQAEEYRAKIKARHATEISDLEALLERTKTELETQRAQQIDVTKMDEMTREITELQLENKRLHRALTEREENEATYREEFEAELEKEFRAMLDRTQGPEGSTSGPEVRKTPIQSPVSVQSPTSVYSGKQWGKEFATTFADEAMREVDEILADTMFSGDASFFGGAVSYQEDHGGFNTPKTIDMGDGIDLPGSVVPNFPDDTTTRGLTEDTSGKFSLDDFGNDAVSEESHTPIAAAVKSRANKPPLPAEDPPLEEEDFDITDAPPPVGSASANTEENRKRFDEATGGSSTRSSIPEADDQVTEKVQRGEDHGTGVAENVLEEVRWVQQYDGSSDSMYFVNKENGSSQWDPPNDEPFEPLPKDVVDQIEAWRNGNQGGNETDAADGSAGDEKKIKANSEVEAGGSTSPRLQNMTSDESSATANQLPSTDESLSLPPLDPAPGTPSVTDTDEIPSVPPLDLAPEVADPPPTDSPPVADLPPTDSPSVDAPPVDSRPPSTPAVGEPPSGPPSSPPADDTTEPPADENEPEVDVGGPEPANILDALEGVLSKLENVGVKGNTEARQVREVKKGVTLLQKLYADGNDDLSKDSKALLSQLGLALHKHDFKEALSLQVKLASGKDWKKHKTWIKPLKFCIELAKKKISGKDKAPKKPIVFGQRPGLLQSQADTKGAGQAENDPPKTSNDGAPKAAATIPPSSQPSSTTAAKPPSFAPPGNGPPAAGASPPAKGNYDSTADGLCAAASRDDVESVKRLLNDVQPNAVNKEGETPLHAAAFAGSYACVRLLLDHRANPASRNRQNETPLDAAMSAMMSMPNPSDNFLKMIDLLEQVNDQSTQGAPGAPQGAPSQSSATQKSSSSWFGWN